MIPKLAILFLTIEKFHITFGESQAKNSSTGNDSTCYDLHDVERYALVPSFVEWILIPLHVVTFVVGLGGNALVCYAVYKNHSMRNVTNYYIVNLAVADFMVILICLPPTVLWDMTETWFLGKALCKIVPYLQTVSVAVSVLTLTFISIDRFYAICHPLKFKSTTTRAKTTIVLIWITSLLIASPDLFLLDLVTDGVQCGYFTQCGYSPLEKIYGMSVGDLNHISRFLLLYSLPLILMLFAYCKIGRVLWTPANIPNHYSGVHHNHTTHNSRRLPYSSTTESQLRSRRKAAKMLCAVVLMFALCYFPVHVLNIHRSIWGFENSDLMIPLSSVIHWLLYANSAINPIIYNFMSGNFRREFKRAFQHCHHCSTPAIRSDVNLMSQNDFAHSFNRRASLCSSKRTRTTSFITQAN